MESRPGELAASLVRADPHVRLGGVAARLEPGQELAVSSLPSSLAETRAEESYRLQKAGPHSRLSSHGAHGWCQKPRSYFSPGVTWA